MTEVSNEMTKICEKCAHAEVCNIMERLAETEVVTTDENVTVTVGCKKFLKKEPIIKRPPEYPPKHGHCAVHCHPYHP